MEITARQSRTYASYPNVRIRACGSFVGNIVWGQGRRVLSAAHVFSRCPVRPWMKTMLKIETTISNTGVVAESSSKVSSLLYYIRVCLMKHLEAAREDLFGG
jgi:hypothetical protein